MAKLKPLAPQSSEEEDESQYSDSDAEAKAEQPIKPQSEEEEEEGESGSETESESESEEEEEEGESRSETELESESESEEEEEEGAKPLATKPVGHLHEASNGAPISKPIALETKSVAAKRPAEEEEEVESESETESESKSESESDGVGAVSKAKSTKPAEQKQKASNAAPISKPIAPAETKSASAKRPAEDTAAHQDAKRLKTTTDEPEKTTKSNLFKRVWSEKDEVAILQGMIDYALEKKDDPISNLSTFLDYIKPNLDLQDVSRSQLQDKIRRLKKKYENNTKRKEKEGKEIKFSNPHELKSYDLSKLIWGWGPNPNPKANGNGSNKSKSGGGEDVDRLKSKSISVVGANAEERMLIAAKSLSVEGKEEWEKLKEEELELYLKQLEVKVAKTKFVLENMKAKNNR